jgi:hypothetical protein
MSDPVKQLTIITVSYHDLVRLRRTVESLIQFDLDLDHLIVLPKNDLESILFLEDALVRYPKKSLRFIHDDGVGIYQAMSLGVQHVLTNYFTFWNSGDQLFSSFEMKSLLSSLSSSDANWILTNGNFDWMEYPPLSRDNLQQFIRQHPKGYVSHQCVLFRTSFFQVDEIFDFKYKVAADTDQIYRCYGDSYPLILDYRIVSVEIGAFSAINQRRARIEVFQIIFRRLRGLDFAIALFNFLISNSFFLVLKCKRFRRNKFSLK